MSSLLHRKLGMNTNRKKMFFHVFIFDVYEVELIHQKSKSSTKRYKNQNRKILPNSFS